MTNLVLDIALCIPVLVGIWLAFVVRRKLMVIPFWRAILMTTLISLQGSIAASLFVVVSAITISALPSSSSFVKNTAITVFSTHIQYLLTISVASTLAGFLIGLTRSKKS